MPTEEISQTETPPADAAPTTAPDQPSNPSGPSDAGVTKDDLSEIREALKNNQGKLEAPDFSQLQNAIDSLPDRIVDAIREAGKPKRQAAETPRPPAAAPGGDAPKVKQPRTLRTMWFGEQ